jgi:hypothetical protein
MSHSGESTANDDVEAFIREYPNRQQVKMMTAWLTSHEPGAFSFTGLVDPEDATVITPQATVDYGYCWFSLSEGPAIVHTPTYDKFFSVSVFDMNHNVPAVVVAPTRPIVIVRPGQDLPDGDHEIVTLETDQGLAFTRMVVVDNLDEVRALSASITMEGGAGDMHRPVAVFSPSVTQEGLARIEAAIPTLGHDGKEVFPKKSGDVEPLDVAAAVMQGQLGTPRDSVVYALILTDDSGAALTGEDTYEVTVPANIVHDDGYFSVTVYGTDNKLLIPNEQGIYDRTTYTAEAEADGTYIVTLSPDGHGKNGIPTGKPFYGLLRAYVPVKGADITPKVTRR